MARLYILKDGIFMNGCTLKQYAANGGYGGYNSAGYIYCTRNTIINSWACETQAWLTGIPNRSKYTKMHIDVEGYYGFSNGGRREIVEPFSSSSTYCDFGWIGGAGTGTSKTYNVWLTP